MFNDDVLYMLHKLLNHWKFVNFLICYWTHAFHLIFLKNNYLQVYSEVLGLKFCSHYTPIALQCQYINNYFLLQVTSASLHFKLKWIEFSCHTITLQFLCRGEQCSNATQLPCSINRPLSYQNICIKESSLATGDPVQCYCVASIILFTEHGGNLE